MKEGDIVKIKDSTITGIVRGFNENGRVWVEHDGMDFWYSRSLLIVEDKMDLLSAMSSMKGLGSKKKPEVKKKSEKQSMSKTFDLHQDKLPFHIRGMRHGRVCDAQVAYFLEVLREHEGKHGVKLIFVHGQGDGILRDRLKFELGRRKSQFRYKEANYIHYDSQTALEVTVI